MFHYDRKPLVFFCLKTNTVFGWVKQVQASVPPVEIIYSFSVVIQTLSSPQSSYNRYPILASIFCSLLFPPIKRCSFAIVCTARLSTSNDLLVASISTVSPFAQKIFNIIKIHINISVVLFKLDHITHHSFCPVSIDSILLSRNHACPSCPLPDLYEQPTRPTYIFFYPNLITLSLCHSTRLSLFLNLPAFSLFPNIPLTQPHRSTLLLSAPSCLVKNHQTTQSQRNVILPQHSLPWRLWSVWIQCSTLSQGEYTCNSTRVICIKPFFQPSPDLPYRSIIHVRKN